MKENYDFLNCDNNQYDDEKTCGKFELYKLLNDGLEAETAGRVRPFDEAIDDIRKELGF